MSPLYPKIKMKLLELCCGENKSWSKAGREQGFQCTTLGWNRECMPDICMDVRDFVCSGYYDIVCASPDCKEFSHARSWSPGDVEFADSVARKRIAIILYYVSLGARGRLENPRCALEKRPFMQEYEPFL